MEKMLIHQVSKAAGIPVHTIRFYEKYGLFRGKKDPGVKTNNYSWYDAEVLDKLELIHEAKQIGFSLSEIKNLLDAWYSKRLGREKKIEILRRKLAEIEAKILQMKEVRKLVLKGIRDVEEFDC